MRLAGGDVEPTRGVERDDERRVAQRLDERSARSARRTPQRVADHGVDRDVSTLQLGADRDAQALQDVELMRRDGAEFVRRPRDGHGDLDAGIREVASRNESATAVAARAGSHGDAARCSEVEHESCEVASCVLHHLKQFDVQVLDHDPIDLDHLTFGDPADPITIDDGKPVSFHATQSYRPPSELRASTGGASVDFMTFELTADEVHRVRRLLAEDDIRRLKVRYSQLMDAGRIDDVAELFTEDAVCVFGRFGEWHGRETIRANFAAVDRDHHHGVPFHAMHATTDHWVEITGPDTAIGRSYLIDLVTATQSDGQPIVILGTYDETYRLVDDTWLIERCVLQFLWPDGQIADDFTEQLTAAPRE